MEFRCLRKSICMTAWIRGTRDVALCLCQGTITGKSDGIGEMTCHPWAMRERGRKAKEEAVLSAARVKRPPRLCKQKLCRFWKL